MRKKIRERMKERWFEEYNQRIKGGTKFFATQASHNSKAIAVIDGGGRIYSAFRTIYHPNLGYKNINFDENDKGECLIHIVKKKLGDINLDYNGRKNRRRRKNRRKRFKQKD